MKGKHQYRFSSALVVACGFSLLLLGVGCRRSQPEVVQTGVVVFEGTVEAMAPDPGMVSGRIAVYRLVRYRVEKVCQGQYEKGEMVVDHLILTGKELEGVTVNSRVCVVVSRSNTVLARFDAEGIRSPSDEVKEFFIGRTTPRAGTNCCSGVIVGGP